MELKDKDLTLRKAVATDARQLTDWWNDGRVMEHAGFPNGLGITEEETQLTIENADRKNMTILIIEVENKPVGECNFRLMGDQAEIGIKVCDQSYQNRGFGRRALKLMISHVFNNPEITKVILDTNIKNKRSQHVYRELGFKLVDTRINAWQDQLGAWQTALDFELLRKDFSFIDQ